MKRKIIIAGGSGFLGSLLIKKYDTGNNEIVILTRRKSYKHKNISYVNWDAVTLSDWLADLEGGDIIINLVGKSVNCRYTESNKKEIIDSRVNATLAIGRAINKLKQPPKVWINAGSAAIFGNSGDEIKDEYSETGNGFSPGVCKQWEAAFNSIETPYTRKIFLRIGLVLQKNEGLLKPFTRLVKFGLGGKIGSGEQYLSWIHEKDFIKVVEVAISNEAIKGIVHCTSPFPVTNKDFMKALRLVCNMPFGIPGPAPFTKIGATLIGTEAELVLTGRRVVSKVLEEKKFRFEYENLENALRDLIN